MANRFSKKTVAYVPCEPSNLLLVGQLLGGNWAELR